VLHGSAGACPWARCPRRGHGGRKWCGVTSCQSSRCCCVDGTCYGCVDVRSRAARVLAGVLGRRRQGHDGRWLERVCAQHVHEACMFKARSWSRRLVSVCCTMVSRCRIATCNIKVTCNGSNLTMSSVQKKKIIKCDICV